MTAVDPFDGGHEDILSYLHGVAVANQPGDVETGPVMVPVAFAARVSDKDNQDPTLSIPRQLARCREALPPYCVIVAFFWDVESGRTNLDLRGRWPPTKASPPTHSQAPTVSWPASGPRRS